jgi:RNA polymerase sigma factor (sigma-70 family)
VYSKYNKPENLEFELISDRSAGPEDVTEIREQMAGLEGAIERLSVKDKEILSLLVIDCTPAEISRKLGVTRSAISQRLHRIRRTLTTAISI